MVLNDYDIAGSPDLNAEKFAAILRAGNSPAIVEATAMYDALVGYRVRPAVFLAIFRHESRYGTVGICAEYGTKNPGNVRTPERAGAATAIVDTPRGRFAKYATWAMATADWCERLLGPKYAGRGLTTVRRVLPVYAPSSDQDNVPEAYIKAVLASIEGWVGTGGSTVALTIREAIIPRQANRPGTKLDGGKPSGITIHETANQNVRANAEMHRKFLVNGGGAESVSFHYCVDDKEAVHLLPDDEEGHHAGDGLGPGSCGSTTIGIELCVNADGDWAKTRTNGAQLVALLLRKHNLPASSIRQHFNCSGKNCPTRLRANSNAQWSGFLAGVNAAYALLDAPGQAGDGNEIIPFVHSDGRPGVTILFEGQAKETPGVDVADLGISVRSVTTGETLDQSVQQNEFKGWRARA